MDWKIRNEKAVFLSSTFRDLQNERREVELVINRMSEHYVGMEHWGSYDDTPLHKSLEKAANSDIGVLVLADRYGEIPDGQEKSITELEYRKLIDEKVPILAYFADENGRDGGLEDTRLKNLKDEIRHRHSVSWFSSPERLASMVAADLAREIRIQIVESLPFVQEVQPDLLKRHNQVNMELENRNWVRANELGDEILSYHPFSPRAHYNKACALSRLAEQTSKAEERTALLNESQKAFVSAMEDGMVYLVALYLHKEDPIKTIRGEQDLQYLFKKRKGVVTQYLGSHNRPCLQGFGAHGSCVAADMPVHLTGGRFKAAQNLIPGDVVSSWHLQKQSEIETEVWATRQATVAAVLRINGFIEVTAAHPLLTQEGWLPAGELDYKSELQLASGRFERVLSIELINESRTVVDISVCPTHAFVVAGVVVHNKYPQHLLDKKYREW